MLHLSILEAEIELVDDDAQILYLGFKVERTFLFKNDEVSDLCLSLVDLLELELDMLGDLTTELSIVEGLSTLDDSLFGGPEHLDNVVS